MNRLQPLVGTICSVAQFYSEASTTKQRQDDAKMDVTPPRDSTDPDDDPRLPHMTTVHGTQIRFSHIPRQKYPVGASPAEMTKYSMDHSYVLDSLLQTQFKDDKNGLLGELQFAFLCFLLGQVYDAFEQWKKLVNLICCSDESVSKHTQLFINFISVLHYHIKEVPQDFFTDIVSSSNFLISTLHTLFANLDTEDTDTVLRQRALKFRDHLHNKFKWDFTLDAEEDEPVVVDLNL